MRTPLEFCKKYYEEDWITLRDLIEEIQQEAFNKGRDKALEWMNENVLVVTPNAVETGKTSPELQFTPPID